MSNSTLSPQHDPDDFILCLFTALGRCTEHGFGQIVIEFAKEGTHRQAITVKCGEYQKFRLETISIVTHIQTMHKNILRNRSEV